MTKQYVKIVKGECAGEYGWIRITHSSTSLVVDFHKPVQGWSGIIVNLDDVEFVSEQEYFKGILRAC